MYNKGKRLSGAHRNRVKGRTTARVASVNAIIHLDSTSGLHAEHQELSKRLHAKARQEVTVSVEPAAPPKFPSLQKGLMLDGHGTVIDSTAHLQLLTQLNHDRSYYVTTETRKNGTTYQRKLVTTGIHQLAVTYYPVHSMVFARLDQKGIPVRDLVVEHTRKLGLEFARLTGYEVVAMQIHPNEGILHPHLCYATVNDDHRLLHPLSGRGRRGLRFLGPSSIGTLRLVENGVWPEEDAELAKSFLAGSVRRGQEPVDWVLSRYLDGLAEKSLLDLARSHSSVTQIWQNVASEYSNYAVARREARPDLMAERIDLLAAENEALRAELAALKQKPVRKIVSPAKRGPLGLPVLEIKSTSEKNSRRPGAEGGIGISL